MAILVQAFAGADMVRGQARGDLTAEVFRDLGSVETLWRGLEAEPGAFATPYQRFDWVAAFVATELGPDPAAQAAALRVLVLRDAGGRPRALLPLTIARERGVAVARVVGGTHANFHMPLYATRHGSAVSPEALVDALVRAGRGAGIDVYAFGYQPRFWDGAANPLGALGQPCASDAYGLMLGPDPEATLKRAFSADARKKLRAKERKLVEALGPVEHHVATTADGVTEILDAFAAQKTARFASLGIPDPYAPESVRRFVASATRPVPDGMPAIEVHALVAARSGRVLATFGGAVDARRFSGMWTSFDGDPELRRFSPGDLLLSHLIAHQTAAGRRGFDLGVGEARYKANICDETIELVAPIVPVTLRGHVYAHAASVTARAKRRIKRSPRLFGLLTAARRRLRGA